MDNDRVVEILTILMNKNGWKPADIARMTGVQPSTLSHILKQERGVGQDTITKLVTGLNLNPGVFYSKDSIDGYVNSITLLEIFKLPMYNGFNVLMQDDVMAYLQKRIDVMQTIPTPREIFRNIETPEGTCFWMEIVTDLYKPKLGCGDQVLVSINSPLRNGDLVVCVIKHPAGEFSIHLKRYMGYGEKIILVPENPTDSKSIEVSQREIDTMEVRLYKILRISSIP